MNATSSNAQLQTSPTTIVIVGRGIFGICGAIECAKRFGKHAKVISIGGPLDKESSTEDVSKITRGDYGSDDLYTRLHLIAIERWKQKEAEWRAGDANKSYDSLFHWTGVSLLSQSPHPLPSDSYEASSLETLTQIDAGFAATNCIVFRNESDIQQQVNPTLRTFQTGYHNPNAGWIESGLVLEKFVQEARSLGVLMIDSLCSKVQRDGVFLTNREFIAADTVVVACGAWTPFLLPDTKGLLRATAQPVLLFEPRPEADNPEVAWLGRHEGGNMSPLCLDMAQTGFYCFPFHKRARVLKFGHHGAGYPVEKPMSAELLRTLENKARPGEETRFLHFLDEVTPGFSERWSLKKFRLCQYCDSLDSHFLVDKLNNGIICASGGSGHGFKFGMILGELIADCVEGRTNANPVLHEAAARFRWRALDPSTIMYEKARNRSKVDDVGASGELPSRL